MADRYVDPINGSDAQDGTTWVNAKKLIQSVTGLTAGSTCYIAKTPDPIDTGISGSWTDLSNVVTLSATSSIMVEDCEASWTAVSGFAFQQTSWKKNGTYSADIRPNASSVSTRIAYKTLPSQLDLSEYQVLNFWCMTGAGWAVTAFGTSKLRIDLCSDVSGSVPVNSFVLPKLQNINQAQSQYVLDYGSALGSNINSICLFFEYGNTSLPTSGGSSTYFDTFFVTKAPSAPDDLSLNTMISKNNLAQGGTEAWYGIAYIDGATLVLDNGTNSSGTGLKGYSGTTENVGLFKRTGAMPITLVSTSTVVQSIPTSGTAGNLVHYSGGWDKDTNTKNGETMYFGNGLGYGLSVAGRAYVKTSNLSFCRYTYGVAGLSNNDGAYSDMNFFCMNNNTTGHVLGSNTGNFLQSTSLNTTFANNNNNHGYDLSPQNCTITNYQCNNNGNYGGTYGWNNIGNTRGNVMNYGQVKNNQAMGIELNGQNNVLNFNEISYSSGSGSTGLRLQYSGTAPDLNARNVNNTFNGGQIHHCYNSFVDAYFQDVKLNNIWSHDNVLGMNIALDRHYLNNCKIDEASELGQSTVASSAGTLMKLVSNNHDQTVGNNWIWMYGGTINSQTAVRHTDSGIAWKLSPTNTARNVGYPIDLSIAKVAVASGSLATVSVWMQRNNVGINGQLFIGGGQINGVPTNITSSISAASGSWENVSCSFTPSQNGVVEVKVLAFGGTSWSLFVDDFSVTQA